jgi:hypothetical protein
MKISKATIELLKNYSSINPSIYVESGSSIQTSSPYENVSTYAEVDETFPVEFGIYELSRFLNVISMMPDPDFDFQEKYVQITSGRHSIKYQYASKSMIIYKKFDAAAASSVKGDIEFTLTKNDLSMLRKASALLSMPDLQFQCVDGKIVARVVDQENGTIDDYTTIIGDCSVETSDPISFEFDAIKLIDGDYNVSMSVDMPFAIFSKVDDSLFYVVCVRGDK